MIDLAEKKIMIIAPHMDDEVIGCSGTLLANRSKISEIIIVHMTYDERRFSEFNIVQKILNVHKHYSLNLVDGFVDDSYKESVLKLVELIQKEHPDIIFIPHEKDDHVDHKATNKIAMDAIGKSRYWTTEGTVWQTPQILEYEVWTFQRDVSEVVDISNVIKEKKSIMQIYQSQLDFDYIKYIGYCNGYRGLLFNKSGFAECFYLRRI